MTESDDPGHRPADSPTDQPTDQIGRLLMRLSEILALAGGLVLLFVTGFTILSVVGRTGFNTPVLGDSEIVEVGVAFSIFSFMAYCQMRGANVIVDFFTQGLPLRARNLLDAASTLLFTVVVLILTWRLVLGGIDAYTRSDFSMFLQIPTWWGYVAAIASSLLWATVCLYCAFACLAGRRLAQDPAGR